MGTVVDMSRVAQRKTLARRFAPGLLRPFSGMNVSVRLGEISHTVLSRWPIPPQPAKPVSHLCYLTMCDRSNWLMLRESLFSLYRSWNSLPEITVVSDGSWMAQEFAEVFDWWPMPITVLMREEICLAAMSAGFRELADYARESIWGLELAALTPPSLLRNMVQDALPHPLDSSCEQTIKAAAIKLGGEFFPEKLSLVEFDDVHRFRSRNMKKEGYYSRHYVTPARQLLYRDALKVRLECL